jgi:ATP-dependent protease ClpP protease subunit
MVRFCKTLLVCALVAGWVPCLAQLSDAEIAKRLAEMNQKKAATVSEPANGEPKPPPVVKHAGPTYYLAPLRGEVGTSMLAANLEKVLADAETRSPSVVVLQMDSPGGSVAEVDRLVKVITAHKKQLRIVVWIHKAISAAAITSLSVDDIYVKKGAIFGAATAFRVTREGTAADIEEKMQSAWRATGRSAAELGNHSSMLAEGMIDAEIGIYLRKAAGKPPELLAQEAPGTSVVKRPGKLLTLTASEAVDCGLARAAVEDLDELGKALGFAGWKPCEGIGVALADWWEARLETVNKEWKAASARLDAAIKAAHLEDPSSYDDYNSRPGLEAVRMWNSRSTKCSEALRRAEVELKGMQKLTEEHPLLKSYKEATERFRSDIAAIRARIEAGRVRVPIR